jgi:hypothetical protein
VGYRAQNGGLKLVAAPQGGGLDDLGLELRPIQRRAQDRLERGYDPLGDSLALDL